jgi:hypothetical protein
MRVVLFLGAGFSQPFGLPTMNRFLEVVASSNRLNQEDRDFVGRLVLEARQANSFLESSPQNLEDILSFAVMGQRLGLGDDQQAERIRRVLHRVYCAPKLLEGYWNQFDGFERFLGCKVGTPGLELSIVTTNYDLNAECSLLRAQSPARLPFAFEPCTSGAILQRVPTPSSADVCSPTRFAESARS